MRIRLLPYGSGNWNGSYSLLLNCRVITQSKFPPRLHLLAGIQSGFVYICTLTTHTIDPVLQRRSFAQSCAYCDVRNFAKTYNGVQMELKTPVLTRDAPAIYMGFDDKKHFAMHFYECAGDILAGLW